MQNLTKMVDDLRLLKAAEANSQSRVRAATGDSVRRRLLTDDLMDEFVELLTEAGFNHALRPLAEGGGIVHVRVFDDGRGKGKRE